MPYLTHYVHVAKTMRSTHKTHVFFGGALEAVAGADRQAGGGPQESEGSAADVTPQTRPTNEFAAYSDTSHK